MEKQFAMYVKRATLTHETGEGSSTPALKLLRQLEARLDNVVYRAGFAINRALARQMVSHGHVTVNGRRINIASHQVKVGDVIAIREGSKTTKLFTTLEEKLTAAQPSYVLTVDPKKFAATVKAEIREVDGMFDTQKVLEYYSR
jgi:small subunit ribosomal protein S4